MKATLDIPDDLYRRVKARSALEGRAIRNVAVQLFRDWLEASPPESKTDAPKAGALSESDFERFPWLKVTRPYIKAEMTHNLDEIKEAVISGWGEEVSEKLRLLSEKA